MKRWRDHSMYRQHEAFVFTALIALPVCFVRWGLLPFFVPVMNTDFL
jgi:hypothetical protein